MFLCNKAIIKARETVGSLRSLKLSWPVRMYTLTSSIVAHVALASSIPAPQGWEQGTEELTYFYVVFTLTDPFIKGPLPQGCMTFLGET